MAEERIDGIVLRSQEYKENQRIITAFTPQGLMSFIVKGLSKKNSQLLTLTSPFCEVEFLFKRGKSDLHFFNDGSILDNHLMLRQRLASLQTAGDLAHAILSSQLIGKPSFELFQLFRLYLKQIPHFDMPKILLTSFQLKLLTHEGLLWISSECNLCGQKARVLSKGESLCPAHPLEEAFTFSCDEWSLLLELVQAKQFTQLREKALPPQLPQKVDIYFKFRIS